MKLFYVLFIVLSMLFMASAEQSVTMFENGNSGIVQAHQETVVSYVNESNYNLMSYSLEQKSQLFDVIILCNDYGGVFACNKLNFQNKDKNCLIYKENKTIKNNKPENVLLVKSERLWGGFNSSCLS